MKKIKLFSLFIFTLVSVTACFETGSTSNRYLRSGQWTHPESVGGGNYLIGGYDTQDAVAGGNSFCSQQNKQFKLVSLTPNTRRVRATLIFSCD